MSTPTLYGVCHCPRMNLTNNYWPMSCIDDYDDDQPLMRLRRDVSGIFLYKIFVEKSIRITLSCVCVYLWLGRHQCWARRRRWVCVEMRKWDRWKCQCLMQLLDSTVASSKGMSFLYVFCIYTTFLSVTKFILEDFFLFLLLKAYS